MSPRWSTPLDPSHCSGGMESTVPNTCPETVSCSLSAAEVSVACAAAHVDVSERVDSIRANAFVLISQSLD